MRSTSGVRGYERRKNKLRYTVHIGHDVIVPEAQDAIAALFQILVPAEVGTAIGMLAAVSFDHDRSFETGEVDNIGSDDMLPPKLEGGQPPIAKHGP